MNEAMGLRQGTDDDTFRNFRLVSKAVLRQDCLLLDSATLFLFSFLSSGRHIFGVTVRVVIDRKILLVRLSTCLIVFWRQLLVR